ncbi:fatty acyl-AMP ligase [Streptomyces sp. NPDC000658]|uniref:fatty acyl-AMP ligase n=1 Tax=Streptomyces sp. NPDC000658 TaxID=3154266 RepID=UPI0033260D48
MTDTPHPPPAPARRSLPEYVRHWAEATPDRRAFTFVDHPAAHPRGVHRTLTWRRLDLRVRALAARLAEEAEPGARVALLCPQGTRYVTAFLAALAARMVAVPLYPPGLPGHGDRLSAVLADARPAVVVTTSDVLDEVREFCAGGEATVVAADLVPDAAARDRPPVAPDDAAVAYLQYTSGSTRTPAGVEITHANVVANAHQALTAYVADGAPVTCVGWLPLYHDMGLVLSVAAPVARGALSVLMDPVAFLHEPARWLRLLSAHPHAVSAAPNFAYDYCASAVTEGQKAELRLDRITALINGSEPVRPATADAFQAAFADRGLVPQTHCPSYGLAEATVFVSAARPWEPLRRFALDRDALGAGKALPARPDDPTAVLLAGCGAPAGQQVRIADPASRTTLPEGEVGEIWVRGPNVGRGYRDQGGPTRRVFDAELTEPPSDPPPTPRPGSEPATPHTGTASAPTAGTGPGTEPDPLPRTATGTGTRPAPATEPGPTPGPTPAAGPGTGTHPPTGAGPGTTTGATARTDTASGPTAGTTPGAGNEPVAGGRRSGGWLRTGDLGTVLDGQLIVTGRLKDLIVVDGRNHYPQDVEATVQEAHPAVRRDRLAAFAVPGPEGERAAVVAEHARTADPAGIDVPALVRAVRAAVSARHGLRLADVVLVPPGAVPRTSSGKVSRTLARERYLAGAYATGTGTGAAG